MKFQQTRQIFTTSKRIWYGPNTALYVSDPDTALIVDLMRHERDKLGFIPITSLLKITKETDSLIWQRDGNNHKIGYLIHSPPRHYKTIHVWLTVIDIDKRRRKWATRAVAQLIRKAYDYNAPEIRLRCAADLEANAFWQASGFQLVAAVPNMRENDRLINEYALTRSQFKHIISDVQIPSIQIPSLKIPPRSTRGLA